METLPLDILENIFSRLPIELKLQCKRVCRTWRPIVGNNVGLLFNYKKAKRRDHVIQLYYGDPQYETKIEKYYSKNTLTPLVPRVVSLVRYGMVGSCNGLVCHNARDPLSGQARGIAFICSNPITGEVAYIPGFEKHVRSLEPSVGGFGYVGSTNEYKVVRLFSGSWKRHVQVYTLGSHLGWRDIREWFPGFFSAEESGIFANGAIHWINVKGYAHDQMILAFGLANEKFWHIPPYPPFTNSKTDCRNSKLILLGGNLCVVHAKHQSTNKRLDIWVFKKNVTNNSTRERKAIAIAIAIAKYDHTWSWSKEYCFAWEGEVMYTPFVITKRNTLLLWQNGTSNLYCYDPQTSTLQAYGDGDEGNLLVQAIPHMNSLVSLKDLGEPQME